MKIDHILSMVEPKWHEDFMNFVETGELSSEFKAFLETDKATQDAVEEVFKMQTEAFQELARKLKAGSFN